jgi:hypothetical protein
MSSAWRSLRQAFSSALHRRGFLFALLSLGLLLAAGCARAPEATDAPRPTATFIPYNMEVPIPVGTPVRAWHTVPIMPGATAGSGDDLGYTFAVQATAEEIQAFYKEKMPLLGFVYEGTGDADPNAPLLVFRKSGYTVTVSYFPQEDEMLVLIVR